MWLVGRVQMKKEPLDAPWLLVTSFRQQESVLCDPLGLAPLSSRLCLSFPLNPLTVCTWSACPNDLLEVRF